MKLSEIPLFKATIFRQAKYLVSSPQKAQSVLAITETGGVGVQPLPLATGFMKLNEAEAGGAYERRRAWAAVHALKLQVYKDGQPTDTDAVLVVSERDYIPLDPLNTLKQKDREKLASLKDIAKIRHAQARSMANMQDSHKNLAEMIIQWGFIIIGIYAVIAFVRGL